jgi:hypothetical protein
MTKAIDWRIRTNSNEDSLIDWSVGLSESVILASVSFIFFTAYIFLARPEIFRYNSSVSFYTILLLIGIITNVKGLINLDIKKNTFLYGLGYGVIGFFFLAIFGVILSTTGFQLLSVSFEVPVYLLLLQNWVEYILGQLSPLEQFAIQVTFVAFGEELVYRNTVPMIIDVILRRTGVGKELSLSIGFGVSTVMFGSAHFFAYEGNPIQLMSALIAGGVLATLRFWSGSASQVKEGKAGGVWTTVVAHLLYNIVAVLGLFSITQEAARSYAII